mgnify:CR=1 FL=1
MLKGRKTILSILRARVKQEERDHGKVFTFLTGPLVASHPTTKAHALWTRPRPILRPDIAIDRSNRLYWIFNRQIGPCIASNHPHIILTTHVTAKRHWVAFDIRNEIRRLVSTSTTVSRLGSVSTACYMSVCTGDKVS